MDDQRFWTFVESAREAAGDDVDDRVSGLELVLLNQHPDEVQEFQDKYDELLQRANRRDLWDAAWLMNGGCTDAGFHHFRDWLISEGEQVFEAALADSQSLAGVAAPGRYELAAFGEVAAEVFEQMTDVGIRHRRAMEDAEPAGATWRADDLPARYPRLAERFAR